MDASPLAALPRELRDQIYTCTLTLPTAVEMCPGAGPAYLRLGHCSHTVPSTCLYRLLSGLPATCRQIRTESLPIFFAANTFRASAWDSNRHVSRAAETMQHWLRIAFRFRHTIPAPHWALVKKVVFDMGVWKPEYMPSLPWGNLWRQVGSLARDIHGDGGMEVEVWVFLQGLGDLYVELRVPFGEREKARGEVGGVMGRIEGYLRRCPDSEDGEGLRVLEGAKEILVGVFEAFPTPG